MNVLDHGVASAVFVVAILAAAFFLLRRARRYSGHLPRDERPLVHVSPRDFEPRHGQEGVADFVVRAEVQLHEQTRAAFGKLDSKIGALEYLTGAAQQQIERLQLLIERAELVADDPSGEAKNVERGSPRQGRPE
jgi:hypothetical protein